MNTRLMVSVLALSFGLVIIAGSYYVHAAGDKPEAGAVAMVDLQRVYGESDSRKAAEQKIADYGRKLGDRFDEIAAAQYLTAKEIEEYSDALNAEKPGPAEKTKIDAIKAESAKRATEAQGLTSKKDADLTAADRMRITELSNIRQSQGQVMLQLQRLYQQMVNNAQAKETSQGLAEVRTVISKLAQDQKLAQVFDTSCLVYAQVDLTSEALKKVQKKK